MVAEAKRYVVTHSDVEWRRLLTPEQYAVMRGHGTERPGRPKIKEARRRATIARARNPADDRLREAPGWISGSSFSRA